jgi:hypothetical protein
VPRESLETIPDGHVPLSARKREQLQFASLVRVHLDLRGRTAISILEFLLTARTGIYNALPGMLRRDIHWMDSLGGRTAIRRHKMLWGEVAMSA